MKTVWRVIGLIGLAVLTLGAVCVVVGLITGGSVTRISDTLFANYDVQFYIDLAKQILSTIMSM
jgi:hypothetical protein